MPGNLWGWLIVVVHLFSFLLIKSLTRAGVRSIAVTVLAAFASAWIVTYASGWRAFQYALLLVCVDMAFSDLIGRRGAALMRKLQTTRKSRSETRD